DIAKNRASPSKAKRRSDEVIGRLSFSCVPTPIGRTSVPCGVRVHEITPGSAVSTAEGLDPGYGLRLRGDFTAWSSLARSPLTHYRYPYQYRAVGPRPMLSTMESGRRSLESALREAWEA